MELTFSIRFCGDLLPGRMIDEVKQRTAELFKLTPEQCERLFSGRPVVLRKGVPAAQLNAYLARLQQAGLQVDVQPEEPPPVTSAAPVAASQALPAALVQAPASQPEAQPAVEEVVCPRCGERQPKRTLCRSCALDMPRFIAAQAAQIEEDRAAVRAAREEAKKPKAQRSSAGDQHYDDAPAFWSLSLGGRVGRRTYLAAGFLTYALLLLLVMLVLRRGFSAGSLITAGVVALLLAVWGMRHTVLRLHDVGYSGWFALLCFVPYLGGLVSLILMLMPGKREDNAWGERGPSVGWGSLLGCVAVSVLATFWFGQRLGDPQTLAPLMSLYSAATGIETDEADQGEYEFVPILAAENLPKNTVVILAPPNCPSEHAARARDLADQLTQTGVPAVMRSSYSARTEDNSPETMTRIKNAKAVLNQRNFVVIIEDRASVAPSFDAVMAEYQRSR